jgi:hypothetical protein
MASILHSKLCTHALAFSSSDYKIPKTKINEILMPYATLFSSQQPK